MRIQKSAYELSQSQVSTPPAVISLFWRIVRQRRPELSDVLDLGAGDARFAKGGHYSSYVGVEIDPRACRATKLPRNATIVRKCAFRMKDSGFDACIGNPPYVRHHDIEAPWREKVATRIKRELGIELNGNGNLYLYFMCLALLKTAPTGLVGLVVPFEWVSRPSAKPIRDYIEQKGWDVSVFRFQGAIFEDVLTTASITIIDKSKNDGGWTYHDISPELRIGRRTGISGARFKILDYSKRGEVWARRGISPGGQKTFVLTETGRIEAGLRKCDVVPCVTTLRPVPQKIGVLDAKAFQKYFVDAGRRCWLIRSNGAKLSKPVKAYLETVHPEARDTYACRHQEPWYRFEKAPIPPILFHSGFMQRSPKVVINSIKAQAVGSMYGVHLTRGHRHTKPLRNFLSNYNFERRIVAHAHTLRKVEVAQLNSVLVNWKKAKSGVRKTARKR